MSILIKGMEMPKSCSACPMCDRMDWLCHATRRWLDDDEYWTWYVYPEGDTDDSKPCNCPLVEVPPHGDLIDVDALLDMIESAKQDDPEIADVYEDDRQIVLDWLTAAPTVIEREEA